MGLETTPTHPQADSYVTQAEADAYFSDRKDVSGWESLTDDQKEALLKRATNQINTLRFHGCQFFRWPQYGRDKQILEFPRTNTSNWMSGVVESAGNNFLIDSILANNENYPSDYWNDGAVVITNGTGKGQTRKISDFDSSTGKIIVSEDWALNPDSTSAFNLIQKIPDKVKFAVYEQVLYIVSGGGKRQQLQSEGVQEYRIDELHEKFVEGGIGLGNIAISNEAKGYLAGLWSRIGKLT